MYSRWTMIKMKSKEKVLHICLYNSFTLPGLKNCWKKD